jgi:hypothetical protein
MLEPLPGASLVGDSRTDELTADMQIDESLASTPSGMLASARVGRKATREASKQYLIARPVRPLIAHNQTRLDADIDLGALLAGEPCTVNLYVACQSLTPRMDQAPARIIRSRCVEA